MAQQYFVRVLRTTASTNQRDRSPPPACMQVEARDVLFKDRAATLLWTVQRLPALKELDILHWAWNGLREPVSDTNGLPRCQELAQLHSGSLTRLSVCMLDGPAEGNVLRLDGLPELQHCELIALNESQTPLNIIVTAASFDGV